jgi:CheY-like chemotaxis protein
MPARRILIVGDDPSTARTLAARLTALGYEVTGIAGSGRDAIALAGRMEPDLVLMDATLRSDMDSVATAREIRLQRPTPVVFLTADADHETLHRARATGLAFSRALNRSRAPAPHPRGAAT